MDNISYILALLLPLVLLYTLWRKSHGKNPDGKLLPPEIPGAWPIIGHLHLLGDELPLARILGALADQHGPIFTLWLGMHRAVVISDRDVVRECFTAHDKVLAGRPTSSAGEFLGYNYAGFGFLSYGPYWSKIRKLVVSEVLSVRRLEKFSDARLTEVGTSIRELHSTISGDSPAKINLSDWLEKLTLNTIVKVIAGKRYRTAGGDGEVAGKRSIRAVTEYLRVSGESVLSDAIPIRLLRWLDFKGVIKSMKKISKEIDAIIGAWIDEHVERKSTEDDVDFIDVLLSLVTDELVGYGHTKHTIIKATIVTLMVAGSDTTSLTMIWAMSLLINNKDVMERAREEIDNVVGVERWVQESDIKSLVYLQAIVKETLRLYPPGPLAVPHVAMEDCDIMGYHILKDTRLFVNLWKLHRNPRVWEDPEEFRPERFLNGSTLSEVDYFGQHFEFIPFGSGRRSCPGITFAMQVCHLVLARLIQGFDFSTISNVPVDMTEGLSFSLPKAKPLELLVAPRLPAVFYGFDAETSHLNK